MASLSPLQLALKSAYESGTDNLNVQQNMLNHLGDGCFYLQDFEMDLVEIPYLIKFLQSKPAIKEIKSVELVLKPGVAPEQRRRKPTVHAKQVTKQGESSNNRLLMAVFDFIRHSHGMELIMLDNVTFTNEQMAKLSEAMSATPSRLNKVMMTNCPIGSHGLRTLTPAINKLQSITQVTVKGCGLTDDSANFLCSILRASVAHMDQLYWNSTLRMSDPIDGSLDSSTSGAVMNEETNHVFSSGLVVLDVSDNELTSSALEVLSHQLKNNHWLLALDLTGNKIDEAGLLTLADTLSAGQNSALGNILVRGNPGFGKTACEKLQEVTDAASDRLDCMPADLYEVLKDRDTLRMEEAASASGIAPKSAQEEAEAEAEAEAVDAGEVNVGVGDAAASLPAGARTPTFPGDGDMGGDRPVSAGSGRGVAAAREMEMDMEFSIPTPVDGDTTTFQGSPSPDPATSPAAQFLAGDSADGRPLSRGSLRPRPQQGANGGIFSPATTVGPGSSVARGGGGAAGASNRRKVNRGGLMSRSVGSGGGLGGSIAHPGIGSLDSVDLLNGPGLAVDRGALAMASSFEAGGAGSAHGRGSMQSAFWAAASSEGLPMPMPSSSTRRGDKDRAPFYPGGAGSTYQNARDGVTPNPRLRAAKYAEQVRMMQLCMPPPGPVARPRRKKKRALRASSTGTGKAADSASTTTNKGVSMSTTSATANTQQRVPSARGGAASTGGRNRTDRKLELLTGAVEKVTRQLEITAERITDLSDSLSESVVNLSLNSGRLQNPADTTSASMESGASAGARGKAVSKSTQRKGGVDGSPSPSRYGGTSRDAPGAGASSLADIIEAPSPVKGGGGSGGGTADRASEPSSSPTRTKQQGQGGTRCSPVSSPSSSPSRTKNRDKDVSRIIRNSMREKLDKYLDELQF